LDGDVKASDFKSEKELLKTDNLDKNKNTKLKTKDSDKKESDEKLINDLHHEIF